MSLSTSAAFATTFDFSFDASLDSGSLAGTLFTGTGSYNAPDPPIPGVAYVGLTSLNFSVDGQSYTLADNYQGGQAILDDGSLDYFTAAFLPEGPLETIAFGFGGPGIIGYEDDYGQFGEGTYTAIASEVPEPASGMLCGTATAVLLLASLSRKRPRRLVLGSR